jgi:hypothetical protein
LIDLGFEDADSIVRTWRDRGWLEVDKDRARVTKTKRFLGSPVKVVVLKREAVDEEFRSDVG